MSPLRYKEDLWLCNLDWEQKKFRGKAMTKAAMKKLLQDIEDHTERQKEAFLSASCDVGDGEEFKYMVTAQEPVSIKRRVHMPGYPGYKRGGRGYPGYEGGWAWLPWVREGQAMMSMCRADIGGGEGG